jgi:hypothetical protein
MSKLHLRAAERMRVIITTDKSKTTQFSAIS